MLSTITAHGKKGAGRPPRATTPDEDPAQQGRTNSYISLTERLNIPQVQESWEELYSGM